MVIQAAFHLWEGVYLTKLRVFDEKSGFKRAEFRLEKVVFLEDLGALGFLRALDMSSRLRGSLERLKSE